MTMLATVEKKELLTLADYEARIYLYKEQIGTGFIGIGRTLLEAKEANVVPHGEWEAWMTRTTGLAPSVVTYILESIITKKFGGHTVSDELGLPVTESGLVLPCGATGRWTRD